MRNERISKDNQRVTITEYTVNTLDSNDDIIDVSYFESKEAAIKFANGLDHAEIEKVIRKYPAFLYDEPVIFETIYTK